MKEELIQTREVDTKEELIQTREYEVKEEVKEEDRETRESQAEKEVVWKFSWWRLFFSKRSCKNKKKQI